MKHSKNGPATADHAEKEALSPEDRQNIVGYVRSQLKERIQQVLVGRDNGKTFEELARDLKRDLTTMHHDSMTGSAQISLVLDAPWLKEIRAEILKGKRPPLPEAVTTLNCAEVAAAKKLSAKQKRKILQSRHTVASRIARELGEDPRAVSGTLKMEEGRWPLLNNDTILTILKMAKGNASLAAEMLGVKRDRISHRLRSLGVEAQGRSVRRK